MEKDDFLKDDYLRELIQSSPLDTPSDDFVERVMKGIETSTEGAEVKKPYYYYIKTISPYLLIGFLGVFVITTSDLPIFNWMPGKSYFLNTMVPYLGSLFAVVKTAFASKYVSWVVLISVSSGLLYFVDRIFSRHASV